MKGIEEERRLFYVALTRSEKTATITYAASRYKWGLQTTTTPSHFIKEIDGNCVELPHDFYPVIPGTREETVSVKPRTTAGSYPNLQKRSHEVVGDKPLLRMEKATASTGTPATMDNVTVGMKVEHPRFGIGTVIAMEGEAPNTKATVDFPIGKKQLLLKFAKLNIVG